MSADRHNPTDCSLAREVGDGSEVARTTRQRKIRLDQMGIRRRPRPTPGARPLRA